MLDLKRIDLADLAYALEDRSDLHQWWFDSKTGETELWSLDRPFEEEAEEEHPEERGLILVESLWSDEAYRDLEDFTALVRDPRAHDLLGRAIEGRGAFRRFKDTLFEFPELRAAWHRFHDARMERRALDWLVVNRIVDQEAAEGAVPGDPDLPELSGSFDPVGISGAVTDDLRRLYGERLRSVILFGSWARGDAHPESDIDLLVVLDRVESPWEELQRMDGILWRHSIENGTVVSVLVASDDEVERADLPAFARARQEGRAVV